MSQTPPLQVVGSGGRLGGARGASSRQLDLAVFTTDTASALKKTVDAAERLRPDVANARHHWKTALQQKLDPKKLVFIDKTGTATNMVPRARVLPARRPAYR